MLASILLAMRGICKLTSKLSKERESHADGSDFRRENFGDIEVHGGVTEGSVKRGGFLLVSDPSTSK